MRTCTTLAWLPAVSFALFCLFPCMCFTSSAIRVSPGPCDAAWRANLSCIFYNAFLRLPLPASCKQHLPRMQLRLEHVQNTRTHINGRHKEGGLVTRAQLSFLFFPSPRSNVFAASTRMQGSSHELACMEIQASKGRVSTSSSSVGGNSKLPRFTRPTKPKPSAAMTVKPLSA